MSRRIKTERPHHLRAFEIYCGLGDKRSFAKVAAEMSVNIHTAKLWSASFNWKRRIAEREKGRINDVRQRAIAEAQLEEETISKAVSAAKKRLLKDFLEGRLKGTLGDFIRLAEYERDLARDRGAIDPSSGSRNSPPGVVIYIPHNGRGPADDAVDVTNPLHPDYPGRKPQEGNDGSKPDEKK